MVRPIKVMTIIGTRPEAIKLAPVVRALAKDGDFQPFILATAQHRALLDQVLAVFDVAPDEDLDLMTEGQTLESFTAACLEAVGRVVRRVQPHIALVQGDTTTVLASGLACYYARVPFGHVEAGLRTADKYSPFPEEGNRRLASALAELHFAPTERARDNLLLEGVRPDRVFVTGNTVVDALLEVAGRSPPRSPALAQAETFAASVRCVILVTAHRRESFGEPLAEMCRAIRSIAERHPDVGFIYPVHPNPNVRETAHRLLRHPRILLLEPVDYVTFVHLLKSAYFVLTDSGGVQEEAPSLRKPVLVMRDTTERPEGVEAGVACVVGTRASGIEEAAERLLTDACAYRQMASGKSPFGDGTASRRIIDSIRRHFQMD